MTLLDLGAHRLKDLGRPEQVFQVCHRALRREFPRLRSLDAVPNNLPVHLTSFIGRESELADLAGLTGRYRLVTLTGSGGVGKTRLAARIAAELAGTRVDGIWWVELAPLADPGLVVDTVLGVLQVGDAPGSSALQRLTAHLATREVLLVLDNCEHVLDACAALSDAVLRTCPGAAVLATSREPLGVGGEITWQVPPMALPRRDVPCPVESLRSFDGVRLFLDRATKARPNFAVTNETAPVVAEICAQLDGIPLAIELAAARARVLTPQQILAGLEDRFRLLTGGVRGGLPRQQTLEASVEWSHDLLGAEERVLFRRLAVFAGGFALDAAEAVAASWAGGPEGAAILDLLDGLVTKCLVLVDEPGEGAAARYRMLETIRAFAARELARAEETGPARDAHLEFALRRARGAEAVLKGVNPAVVRAEAAELDNYRVAAEWALASGGPGPALELASGFGLLLVYLGRYREGQEWSRRALAMPGAAPAARAETLWTLGGIQWCLCDIPGLEASAAEALALSQEAGTARAHGRDHHLQALLDLFVDPQAALASIAVAERWATEAGDDWILLDLAYDQAFLAVRADDPEAARGLLDRAHALADRHGNDWFRGWNHVKEALAQLRLGALDAARPAAERTVALARGLGDVQAAGFGTGILADIALLQDAPAKALALTGPALQACTESAAYVALPYLMAVRGRALAALGHPDARAALEEAAEVGDAWQHAQALLPLAALLVEAGELGTVDAHLDEARRCGRQLGSPWVAAAADHVAGLLAAARGEPGQAEDLHHVALAIHAGRGYAIGVVDALEAIAVLAASQESWAEAARLASATARRRDELGYRQGGSAMATAGAAARAELGEEAYEAARAEGAALTIEEAVAYASRSRGERKRPSSGWRSLTPTELDVARLAAQGLSNAEIGTRLFISAGTVKVHLSHTYAKLNLANRAQLTAEVTRRQ